MEPETNTDITFAGQQRRSKPLTRSPKLAVCNFMEDARRLRRFALEYGFDGVDWSFNRDNLPGSRQQVAALVDSVSELSPLEVRYHCFLENTDLGHVEDREADRAAGVFRSVCEVVSAARGEILTVHIGIGRESTADLSWDKTVERLGGLVEFGESLGVRVCLENLAWGWTSRPPLFEKLLRKSGCWGTFDIGHARVSSSVTSRAYLIEDFVAPHPDRVLNAHIYHEETDHGHTPPKEVSDVEERLSLLARLSRCDWWVLELREENALLETLAAVRTFLDARSAPDSRCVALTSE
ncbi:MAG: TIM barrel protein [Desulfomonile tiedjei]|nr:TIM barrel protein [Desulfomonile tiedjei]